jgi:hypothetical protein
LGRPAKLETRRTLAGALAVAVAAASASQTFSAPVYRSASYACGGGAADTSGAKYGTFNAVETHGDQVVNASVSVNGLHAFRTYKVSVTESGNACLTNSNVAQLTTDAEGKGVVHFPFWAHSGEAAAWVTIRHGLTDDIVRSTALPINH